MHGRILEHAYPSSSHNSATFAFLLAVETAQEKGIDCETPKRDELHNTPAFRPLFKVAKKRVRGMEFRVVEINDAIEQAVFEVYAAMELGTTLEQGGYNDFDNH